MHARIRKYTCPFLAGAFLAIGGPPFDFVPALWFGMVALAWSLSGDPAWPMFASRSRVVWTGALRGLVFGLGANVVALRFVPGVIARFTPLPWALGVVALILLAAFEGSRWMLAGVVCETLARVRVPRPVGFAVGVYAGTFVPTVLPWTVAGGASLWPSTVQFADVVGERGVAALMALTAGAFAYAVRAGGRAETRRRAIAWFLGGSMLLGIQTFTGRQRMQTIEHLRDGSAHLRVALIQPSIDAELRWDESRGPTILSTVEALTRRAQAQDAELVVWHEAAYPYRLPHGSRSIADPSRALVQPGVHVPILAGLMTSAPDDESSYNSALVARVDRSLSPSYDKRHLLWFGETIPFADRAPWLRHVFARGMGLTPGTQEIALTTGSVRAAVLICYEDILPDAGREAMTVNPNLLVNVTNDAWFAGSHESELHARVATMRAIETRRDMVRAVNLGETSWVDAAGRVQAAMDSTEPGILMTEPALIGGDPTFYVRWGDTPWQLLLLVGANIAVWAAARAQKPNGASSKTS